MSFILGRKFKMTQIWKDSTVVPVTVIKAAPNMVSIVRVPEKDCYSAVQLALGKAKKEFRLKGGATTDLKKGDAVDVTVFAEGDTVSVSGHTMGRGFQGVVKRYGFHGGPKTHGQKNRFRAPGSIGSTAPQRVVPGRRMAGHMGTERVTVKNLRVVGVNKDEQTILVRGAVPGVRGSLLEIVKVMKKAKKK
jgi:large subunit ribosomal protein L3